MLKEMQLTPTYLPPPSLQKQTNFTSGSTSHPMGLDTGNSMKNENTPVFIFHFEKHIRNTSQQNSSYLYAYIHVGTKWRENITLSWYFISVVFCKQSI